MNNQELPRRALDLSLAIYRITAKFPAGEALIGQTRGLGNEIAGDLAAENFSDIKNKINRLKIYFVVAKAQNWVSPINWSILDFEYFRLQREVLFELAGSGPKEKSRADVSIMSHNIKQVKKSAVLRPVAPSGSKLNERQAKIMEVLDRNAVLKMSDLIPLFKSDISERTLRNELNEMVRMGAVRKKGANRFTEYFRR